LLWFGGDAGPFDDRNALLRALGGGHVDGLDGVPDGSAIDAIDRIDLEHPLFDGVLDSADRTLERPDIRRRLRYLPSNPTESIVIGLSSGTPLLQEIRHGAGSVLLFTVAADPSWSDLPTRGLFVPLLYRSIFLLSSSGSAGTSVFLAGARADLMLPRAGSDGVLSVVAPDGIEAMPDVRGTVSGSSVSLAGLTGQVGYYDILMDGSLIRRIAINNDPRESVFATLSDDAAVNLLRSNGYSDVRVVRDASAEQSVARLSEGRRGIELWNVFLLVALLFLGAEMIVARQWKPEGGGQSGA
jgi:hypothetical protein